MGGSGWEFPPRGERLGQKRKKRTGHQVLSLFDTLNDWHRTHLIFVKVDKLSNLWEGVNRAHNNLYVTESNAKDEIHKITTRLTGKGKIEF